MPARDHRTRELVGCLLGTAAGDALGLPYEGLSPARAQKLLGPPDRHHLLFGQGLISDDTEHACLVAQALMVSHGQPAVFRIELARRLRWWLASCPAGIGLATLRSLLKLWMGFSPEHSGVFSAGNGPAMRAPLLGASIDDLDVLRELVRASTRITHNDPRAETGAWLIALAAHRTRQSSQIDPTEFFRNSLATLQVSEREIWQPICDRLVGSAQRGETTESYVAEISPHRRGVSGFMLHTVPVVLHAWLSHPGDYAAAVQSVIRCGGDADTTAAITGGLVGIAVGREGIPAAWLSGIPDWPRSISWIERLGASLAQSLPPDPQSQPPWRDASLLTLWPRNALFAGVVLTHGFRRLLPPY